MGNAERLIDRALDMNEDAYPAILVVFAAQAAALILELPVSFMFASFIMAMSLTGSILNALETRAFVNPVAVNGARILALISRAISVVCLSMMGVAIFGELSIG